MQGTTVQGTTVQAATVEEVQAAVRGHARLRPVAGRTKPALHGAAASPLPGTSAPPSAASAGGDPAAAGSPVPRLDLSALAGILDYQPAECTFTARPGTRIVDVERMLAKDGLYLPFDPPFGARGATLGGTVAAGLSGPGRFRYGGVRDFLLCVEFVDGEGRLIRGGARVVKNAAGFSLQHALLGSLGRLGVLVEVTFKVFPQPPAHLTLAADFASLDQAVDALVRLRRSGFELEAADLLPPGLLLLRLGGVWAALHARADALTAWLSPARVTQLTTEESEQAWRDARELTWLSNDSGDPDGSGGSDTRETGGRRTIKVATTPTTIAQLDAQLDRFGDDDRECVDGAGSERAPDRGAEDAWRRGPDARVSRRYSVGGEVAWLGWPGPVDALDRLLLDLGLAGLVLTGEAVANPLIGVKPDERFFGRLRQTLDPRGVFGGA